MGMNYGNFGLNGKILGIEKCKKDCN